MVNMDIKDDDAEQPSVDYDRSPCLYLSDDQVEALGITAMPAPGTSMAMHARVVVRSVTASAEEPDEVAAEGNKPDISLVLCVVEMELTPPAATGSTASRLYGA